MKINELKQKSKEELRNLVAEKRRYKEELERLVVERKTKNVKEIQAVRKDIARILTLLAQ